jgi:hypothetical protein
LTIVYSYQRRGNITKKTTKKRRAATSRHHVIGLAINYGGKKGILKNDFLIIEVKRIPMKSETRSLSPSPFMVPVISSFSTMGRKSCTNSGVYGGAMDSKTW